MKPFLLEIFEYNHFMNQQLIEKTVEGGSKVPDKANKLLHHVLNAHHIWNHRINNEPAQFQVWQMHPASELKFIERTNFEISCLIIGNSDLEKMIQYTNSKGETYSNKIRDILFHVTNHGTYHRAQIATIFRENNLTPLVTDYIFYKR